MAKTLDQDRVRKLKVRSLIWCLFVVLWTVALLTLFLVHVGQAVLPKTLQYLAAKCLHVSTYAFLAVYLKWLPLRRGRWLLLGLLSLHAVGSEFFQRFVPGRHGQFSDVLIDHLGLALGMALTWKCWLPRPLRAESARSDSEGQPSFASSTRSE